VAFRAGRSISFLLSQLPELGSEEPARLGEVGFGPPRHRRGLPLPPLIDAPADVRRRLLDGAGPNRIQCATSDGSPDLRHSTECLTRNSVGGAWATGVVTGG
jgi:hypothetical protein